MPLNLDEEDEVWIALLAMESSLIAEQHSARENGGCPGCVNLYLIRRGMLAYRKRISSLMLVTKEE